MVQFEEIISSALVSCFCDVTVEGNLEQIFTIKAQIHQIVYELHVCFTELPNQYTVYLHYLHHHRFVIKVRAENQLQCLVASQASFLVLLVAQVKIKWPWICTIFTGIYI